MKTCCFYGYESFEYVDLKDLKFFLRPRLMNFISLWVRKVGDLILWL